LAKGRRAAGGECWREENQVKGILSLYLLQRTMPTSYSFIYQSLSQLGPQVSCDPHGPRSRGVQGSGHSIQGSFAWVGYARCKKTNSFGAPRNHLIRNHVFPFSSVVEIQNLPLCSTLLATCACNSFDFASSESAPRQRIQIADIGGLLAASNSGWLTIKE
jgi:hypothetical protein